MSDAPFPEKLPSRGELWDVYDRDRRRTGRTHRRGDPMPPGDYHLAVQAWIVNSGGSYLISRRSAGKSDALLWEITRGSALLGEDSLTAARREIWEELGLDIGPNCGTLLETRFNDRPVWPNPGFLDVWLFRFDCRLGDVVLREGETCGAMWASLGQIRRMQESGAFVPGMIPQALG